MSVVCGSVPDNRNSSLRVRVEAKICSSVVQNIRAQIRIIDLSFESIEDMFEIDIRTLAGEERLSKGENHDRTGHCTAQCSG